MSFRTYVYKIAVLELTSLVEAEVSGLHTNWTSSLLYSSADHPPGEAAAQLPKLITEIPSPTTVEHEILKEKLDTWWYFYIYWKFL